MGLLTDIQTALLSNQPISPILLKLRFLAARLGSAALEAWVNHESEGYPASVEVPDYRRIPASYTGNFDGGIQRISNLPIPPYVLSALGGEEWLIYKERQSISGVEAMISASEKRGANPQLPAAANLVGLIGNNMLGGMHCVSVVGIISRTGLVELQHVLRHRLLEFTIQLETKVPEVKFVEIAQGAVASTSKEYASVTNNITNTTVYGNQANTTIGDVSGGSIQVDVRQGDANGLRDALEGLGFSKVEAADFAEVVRSETPTSTKEPLGKKATAWLLEKGGLVVEKIGFVAAATVIGKAVAKYYGLG